MLALLVSLSVYRSVDWRVCSLPRRPLRRESLLVDRLGDEGGVALVSGGGTPRGVVRPDKAGLRDARKLGEGSRATATQTKCDGFLL